MTWKQLIFDHFRELLLVLMFFVLLGVGIHIRAHAQPGSIAWVEDLTGEVLTAFLGLAAGVKVGQAIEQRKNGNGAGHPNG